MLKLLHVYSLNEIHLDRQLTTVVLQDTHRLSFFTIEPVKEYRYDEEENRKKNEIDC